MLADKRRLLYRPEEAAQVLAVSRATIYVLLARGELRAIHIGRAARIPAAELERWLGEKLAQQTGAAREG